MRYLFLTILLLLAGSAFADTSVKAKSEADCKLINLNKDKVLYEGSCTVKETISSSGSEDYVVKLDNGDVYRFEETSAGYTVHTPKGDKHAIMKDKGEKGVFKWGNKKLVVNTAGHSTSQMAKAEGEGHCKLYNKKSDHYKFKGDCKIKQKMGQGENKYIISFDNGDKYEFVQSGSQYKVKKPSGWANNMATMTDHGNKATFAWGKWELTAKLN
jgi:hypothetical protein